MVGHDEGSRYEQDSMTMAGRFARGAAAVLLAGGIVIATFLCFGVGLPKWLYGSGPESPYGGSILRPFATFAGAYSPLAFVVLAVFLYRKFVLNSKR